MKLLIKNKVFRITGIFMLLSAGAFAVAHSIYNKKQPEGRQLSPELFTDDLKKIYKNALADSGVTISGEVKLLDGENNNKQQEEKSFVFFTEHGKSYTRFGQIQTICSGKIAIEIDTVEKTIVISSATIQAGNNFSSPNSFMRILTDSSLQDIAGFLTEEGNHRTATFNNVNAPNIKSYAVTYDTLNHIIRNTTIEWWKEMPGIDSIDVNKVWRTKINYTRDVNKKWDIDALMKSVLTIKNNQVIISDNYKDYQVRIA